MMTIQRLQIRITAGMTAAIMILLSAQAEGDGSGTAKLTLQMTPLGPVSVRHKHGEIAISPDRHRAAVIATQGSRQMVKVDGQAGPLFSKIVPPGEYRQVAFVTFSPDSESFTYVGNPDGTQLVVVTDGKPGAGYERIRWLQYSPVGHRLAYAGEIPDEESQIMKLSKVIVVVDGKPGPAFNYLQASDSAKLSDFQFSPDGKRFAYIAMNQTKTQTEGGYIPSRNIFYTVVDGEPGPGYAAIGGLRFSPNGQSVAYTVQMGDTSDDMRVVINGQVGAAYRQILPIAKGRGYTALDAIKFSEDGQHFAYVASKSAEPKGEITAYVLVVDGEEVAQEAAAPYSGATIRQPTLSPDAKRWAYAAVESAGRGKPQNVFVTVDGQRSFNYAKCNAIVFSPDSRHVAAIVTNANHKQILIFDGSESEPYHSVALESLQFSPDSNRYAYVAQRERDFVVVVDGRPGPAHPYIDPKSLRFSDDGRHFSYAVSANRSNQQLSVVDHEVRGIEGVSRLDGAKSVQVMLKGAGTGSQKTTLMVDGQPYGSTFHQVAQLQLSPDGSRFAAVGTLSSSRSNKGHTHLLIDGHEGPATWGIMQFVFTPDSRHVVSIVETDTRIGNSSTRSHRLEIDGHAIAEFDRIDIQRNYTPRPYESKVERGLEFLPDGTLGFFAVRDKILYRVLLDSSSLDGLPSLEETTADQPGPRVLLDIGTNNQGPGEPRNLAIAPDGKLFATASRGGKYKQGFLFRLNADGSDMRVLYDFLGNKTDGSRPTSLLYGPDDTLYGILSEGGQNRFGSIFRIGTDGSGFAAIHHFDSHYRDNPAILSVDADGSLYGTCGEPTVAFRIDTESNDFSLIYQTELDSVWRDLEQRRKGVEGTIESYKSVQEQMHKSTQEQMHKSTEQMGKYELRGHEKAQANAKQAMETYAKLIEEGEAELKEIDAQLAQGPVERVEPIGPMIDGGDGFFYGAAEDRLFKLKKDTLEYTRLHTFEGAPLDGRWARTPPMITRNGILYGFTAGGGISNGGVIYRINRDGSGYQLAYNPDQRATFIGNPIEAPDGTVYAVLPTGLYPIDSIDTALPPVDPFGAYTRAENLQFVGQDLYGVAQWGNGRGQIFRYVLPSAGSDSGSLVAVREVMQTPPPVAVPSDSPEPATHLFANTTLPAPAGPTSGTPSSQKTVSGIVKTGAPQANQPAAEKTGDLVSDAAETAETAKDTDKPPSQMEKAAEQVEETAKKAKKLFKSFGF